MFVGIRAKERWAALLPRSANQVAKAAECGSMTLATSDHPKRAIGCRSNRAAERGAASIAGEAMGRDAAERASLFVAIRPTWAEEWRELVTDQ